MPPLEREVPTLDLHLSDLTERIAQLDHQLFFSRKRPVGKVFCADEAPERMHSHGARIFYWASFLQPSAPIPEGDNVVRLPEERESYMLWRTGVKRRVETTFKRGLGDAELQRTWLCTAIGLVRARVLYHRDWFPESQKRTLLSIRRYARDIGPSVFSDFARLSKRFLKEGNSSTEIDMQLTQLVVLTLIDRGMSESDALLRIIAD